MPLSLRIDPWTPAYESAYQIDQDDEDPAPVEVDAFVETADWSPVVPQFRALPDTVAFVDGVQRVETRLIAEGDGRTVYGALASIAAGAAFCRPGGSLLDPQAPDRILALSDGQTHEPLELSCGRLSLRFRVQSKNISGLKGVHEAITDARRELERRLAERLLDQRYPLVIVDGRLTVTPQPPAMAVGLVKTIHRQYLEGEQRALLAHLPARTRTPLFHIPRERAVYSWYVRVDEPRPGEHPWSGLVRLETLDVIGLQPAIQLADLTAQHLSDFASARHRDPRAPQNLYPIGELERRLRRQLGDHHVIRRRIVAHFHEEAAA